LDKLENGHPDTVLDGLVFIGGLAQYSLNDVRNDNGAIKTYNSSHDHTNIQMEFAETDTQRENLFHDRNRTLCLKPRFQDKTGHGKHDDHPTDLNNTGNKDSCTGSQICELLQEAAANDKFDKILDHQYQHPCNKRNVDGIGQRAEQVS